MIVRIPDFLPPDQAKPIIANLSNAPGASPSGPQGSEAAKKLGEDFKSALAGNPVFEDAASPLRMTAFTMLRLRDGAEHVFDLDSYVTGTAEEPVRADLAMTIFLSDPNAYQGGDLIVLEETSGQRIRMPAGSAVIYPATNFHRVEPVRGGERWTAEAVVQSTVRSGEQRQILAEIQAVLGWMGQARQQHPEALGPAGQALRRARANLGRMWTEF